MRNLFGVIVLAILFAAARGKNFNLNFESSYQELGNHNLEPKAIFVKNQTTTIKELKSGDLFQMEEWKDDKFLFLHFDGQRYFYLNLTVNGAVPSREHKNLEVTKIGNVKQFVI